MQSAWSRSSRQNPKKSSFFAFFILIFALQTGCALPRIVVLDDPLSPEEHLNLGVAYERKGELDGAIREYEAAAKKLPVAHLYLGNVYFQKHEFGAAEEHYRNAIERDPECRRL